MNDARERNLALAVRAKRGDERAFDELIESNLGLVRNAARRFLGRGTEYEDLVQIGTIGLIKAARAFKPEAGFAFSTYAFTMVVGEIRRFLRDDGIVKVSRRTKKIGSELLHERETYMAAFGKEPSLSLLAQMCGVTTEEAVFCLEAMNPVIPLSHGGKDDGYDAAPEDTVGEDNIEDAVEKLALREAFGHLSDEEKTIIELRYLAGMTQAQVAQRLHTTQVRISRHEKKILEKLRRELE